ncbi:MAG TPA: hypothetical protein VHE35_23705 [Kofleriaceae bacterium]|nr:hypothetical protein [Kofleriaceae bacterium]
MAAVRGAAAFEAVGAVRVGEGFFDGAFEADGRFEGLAAARW